VIGVVTAWHTKPLLESLNNGFITAIDKALRHTAHIVWMSIDNEGVLYTGELGRLLTGFMAQEPRVLSPRWQAHVNFGSQAPRQPAFSDLET
jgi:hypothetical protein